MRQRFDRASNCASDRTMNGETSETALARIEAALVRIEHGAAAVRAAASAQAAREARLRAAISGALHDLDALIADRTLDGTA